MHQVFGPTFFALALVLPSTLGAVAVGDDGSSSPQPGVLEARISSLINQLGADQYARRERAQDQLRQLGLTAFDALIEAQRNPDIEIALRARYLVRSMPIRWSKDSDPPEVKSLLRNYVETNRAERKNRMQQLANLEDSRGIEALCRLVRFETDPLLSKEAALLSMSHSAPENQEDRERLSTLVRDTIGLSKRAGAKWLLTYAHTLEDEEAALDQWEQITQEEMLTFARSPEESNRELVRDLLRWHADSLRRLGRKEQSLAAVRRSIDLIRGDREELFDFADWALDREAWSVVEDVADRFSNEFNKHAILIYRLAEAQRKRGVGDLANKTASRALRMDAEYPSRHSILAVYLMRRQLYDWSENEYRFVMKTTSPEDPVNLEASFFLADMLFDLAKRLEAAEVLKSAVATIDKNPRVLERTDRNAMVVRGTMHYYYAMHFESIGDRLKQIEHLEQAIRYVPSHVDYIISMFELPDPDPEWRRRTKELLEKATADLRGRIARNNEVLEKPRSQTDRINATDDLAQASNELAWLISCTEGDFNEALERSRKSLELNPDSPAYMDTLARCYYALGDLENAVKYQAKAANSAPFFQQLGRQLKQYERELAAKEPDSNAEDRQGGPGNGGPGNGGQRNGSRDDVGTSLD